MQVSKLAIVFKAAMALLIFWGVIVTFFLLNSIESNWEIRTPQNYERVHIINLKNTSLNSLNELLTNKKYDPIWQNLKAILKDPEALDSTDTLGIDFFSPIVYAESKIDNANCVIVSVINRKAFKQYCKQKGFRYEFIDGQGVILLSPNSIKPGNFKTNSFKSDVLYNYQSKDGSNVVLKQEAHKLILAGKIKAIEPELAYVPKKMGAYFHFGVNAKLLNIDKLPRQIKPFLNTISTLAIDYQGVKVVKEGPQPEFNATFKVNEHWNTDGFLENLKQQAGFSVFPIKDNQWGITYWNQKYYLIQTTDDEWFLGVNPSDLEKNSKRELMAFGGDLTKLMKIDGGFLVNASLSLIPGFSNAKEFLADFEDFHVDAVQVNQQVEINGQLKFKNEQDVLLRLLAFTLDLVNVTK